MTRVFIELKKTLKNLFEQKQKSSIDKDARNISNTGYEKLNQT